MKRTTKIHKFTVYAYGFNDNNLSDVKEIKEIICNTRYDYIIQSYHEKTIERDGISEDHPLNNNNLSKEMWEKYMDDELKRLFENKIKADKELEEYKNKRGL